MQKRSHSPEGVGEALSTRPLFRTLLTKLPDKTPIHLVVRARQRIFDQTISEIDLNDHSHLAKLVSDESDESFSNPRMVDAISSPSRVQMKSSSL
jgi:hypothetical protein